MDGLRFRFFALGLMLALLASPTLAATGGADDEDVTGYDTIVNDLNREAHRSETASSRARSAARPSTGDPFDSIWMHGGVGLTSLMQDIRFDDGQRLYINPKGVQATLGIDLFSEHLSAEGSARSFTESDDSPVRVAIKEFELKLYYRDRFAPKLGFRAGGGLSARYMTIRRPRQDAVDYTTPTSVATVGLDLYLSDRFSIGADISARSALTAETLDRTSYDGTLRMDAHF